MKRTIKITKRGDLGADIKLTSRTNTDQVYWSPSWQEMKDGRLNRSGGCNSYVLLPIEDTLVDYNRAGEFVVDGQPVILTSINGMGEIRWTHDKREIERQEASKDEHYMSETINGVKINCEILNAARYFGLIPDENETETAQIAAARLAKTRGRMVQDRGLFDAQAFVKQQGGTK